MKLFVHVCRITFISDAQWTRLPENTNWPIKSGFFSQHFKWRIQVHFYICKTNFNDCVWEVVPEIHILNLELGESVLIWMTKLNGKSSAASRAAQPIIFPFCCLLWHYTSTLILFTTLHLWTCQLNCLFLIYYQFVQCIPKVRSPLSL